ncbi:MAG: DNA-processing protein DprA, partial [bacterium]
GFSLTQKRVLIDQLGSPEVILNTPANQHYSLLGSLGASVGRSRNNGRKSREAVDLAVKKDLHALAHCGAGFIPFTDTAYPALLNHIDCAPLGLFFRGDTTLLASPQVAVVGSRQASRGGMETAYQFAHGLAQAGLTITSGIAHGIDTHAHRGALDTRGNTIAVIATGIDQVYPAANRALHQQVVESGLVVTEYAPGTPPRRANFPRRNRIISGLSLGTLVVEAGLRSGSLITARLAAEQGREVLAIPGSIHAPGSRGCHHLLRQGAALVECVEDVLFELSWGCTSSAAAPHVAVSGVDCLDPDHRRIYDLIEYSPCPIDQLISLSGLTTEQVSSILTRLEMQGLVSESIGGYQKLPGAPAPNQILKTE